MNYVIIGGAGNTSKPLALQLLKAGHHVTVIGRNAKNLKELINAGATPAIGSVEDINFLIKAFAGADAVYTLVPPKWDVTNWKEHIGNIGKNYAEAIKATGVKYVVNLSSIGAHLPDNCGPVNGLYKVEQALNALPDVNVLHLRAGFFFANFLANISMVKQLNILGGNYGDAGKKLILVDTDDIASVAAEELLSLSFKGHAIRYIASDEKTGGEIASVLGASIGKPDLPWIEFSDEQTIGGLQQAGLSEEISINYAEMGRAMRTGLMTEEYVTQKNYPIGKIRLTDFAKTFAATYHAN